MPGSSVDGVLSLVRGFNSLGATPSISIHLNNLRDFRCVFLTELSQWPFARWANALIALH